MIAFHGKQEVKDFYLKRVREHRAADQIVQSLGYWVKGKNGEFRGCAVGCTLHSGSHAVYEEELGIPQILARLEDGIFEGLPADRAMSWPEEFLTAPAVGVDLSMVWPRFAIWMLVDPEWGVVRFAKTDKSCKAIEGVAQIYSRMVAGEKVAIEEWRAAAAASAAAYAAASAYDASAYAAAASAYDAAASASAYAAAASAYDAAASASAYASAYADADAASASAYASAYADADAATRKKTRVAQADKLLELMAQVPINVAASSLVLA